MRLILWDIDGTLLRAGSLAGKAFTEAVAHVVGRDPGEHGVSMGGKTDPQIAAEILATLTVTEHADHLEAIVTRLEDELAAGHDELRANGRVLPGVETLLARLDTREEVVQTILTGNTRRNAMTKLSALGLAGWFDLALGAFGSDSADREDLVPIAVDRVRAHHGRDPLVTWVVGDTPRDLACARAGGARCLLVATGHAPMTDLELAGAEAVLTDLSDVAAVERILLGETS